MKSNKLNLWIKVAIGVYLLPYILYFIFVGIPSKMNISPEGSDWNDIGGFIEGISGSLMALGNLLAFIILTSKIDEINGYRHNEQKKLQMEIQDREIEIQKKIARSNFQNEYINEINSLLNPIDIEVNSNKVEETIIKLIFKIETVGFLFNKNLEKSKSYKTLDKNLENLKIETENNSHDIDTLVKLQIKVFKSKTLFLKELRSIMLDELSVSKNEK